jgi:serine/threonine-protein kinase
MNNHSPKPAPAGLDSTVSRQSPLPPSDVSHAAESGSTLTPPPQKRISEQVTVADPNAPAPELRLPRTFGKYTLLKKFNGGMGVVYKAHEDTELDRFVALKMIQGGLLATDEDVARFQREARAIALLNHPNIVRVYEYGQEEGRHFFTMAFASGGNLANRQGRFVSDPRGAAALVEKIARAVHYAHQSGIVHRDLKPANILYDEHDVPWVSDFGLAKIVDASLDLTREGQLLGTTFYMPPEQVAGKTGQISRQTDVWALGVILYELLTGQRPFKGESQKELFHKIETMEPPRPRSVNRSLDRELETVILKCLEKEPSQRYASAEALADDLDRWLRGEPTQVRPPGRIKRVWRAVRQRWRTAAALVLLVLLVLTATLVSYLFDPERPLRDIEGRLERGESVVLIGETGKPAWYSLAAGGESSKVSEGADGVFAVSGWSKKMTVVELVRDPRRENYRFRAEVNHAGGDDTQTMVGLYVLHRHFVTPQGTAHYLVNWEFNDLHDVQRQFERARDRFKLRTGRESQQPPPTGNYIRLNSQLFVENELPHSWSLSEALGSGSFKPVAAGAEDPWRPLAIEVTSHGIRAFWDGRLSLEISFADLSKHVKESLLAYNSEQLDSPFTEEEVVNFSPRGGLGLFVLNGSAFFRRVVVEPLEEGK